VATMQDVADRARVSIATVSFVVNNTKNVSPGTRQRILDAIDELGFERNANARALASRKSHVIALLYPLAERNLHVFVAGAAAAASERGYKLVLWPVGDDPKAEVSSLIAGGLADGALLMEVQLDDDRVTRLTEAGRPFVLIGRTRDPSQLSYVDIDFEGTVEIAVDQLAGLGHKNIALVAQRFDIPALDGYAPPVRTEAAFREVTSARGLGAAVFSCMGDPRAGRELAAEIFREAPETTAIIIMNEDASFGLISGITGLGLEIPRDVSLVSIATSERLALMTDPVLTRMVSPALELGRAAAEALVDRLQGVETAPVQLVLGCELHQGESTAQAPARLPRLSLS
jgi:DNA-binding LacI/PurR family transcriptional regulator